MATVVLQYAGAALGSMVGGPIGGIIGRAIGGVAGNIIDQRLFGKTRRSEGPRLNDLRVMASEEGAAIPAIWGRMRVSGQVIWATNIEEVATTETQKASSKGGPKAKSTTYSYYANFAVGLCEGEIDGIGRVWADGKVIDLAAYTTRLYTGSAAQAPDSLISSVESVAPAYRGLAYIVFERLPLERFGNRLPQLSFEVFRRGSSLADTIKSVNIIPGSTEFGYDTQLVTRTNGMGKTESENAHASAEESDWTVSLDQLQATCRNLEHASLVVSWFGNDLRCNNCTITPRVTQKAAPTSGTWQVSGVTRETAELVSQHGGSPAFGGTPSDASVIRAIQDLHARGLAVTFYPFVMMDIPQGNSLPDPYGGAAQPAYPWRGRVTCSVAPGLPGSPDRTPVVSSQINAFMRTASATHFSTASGSVVYSGPLEWGYRRMVLHYASLCALAGGVEAFLIGSELLGMTKLRSSTNGFPFVVALRNLAAEVRSILPTAKISYAADWSEYFGYQPQDGSGDVYYHLDALWADANIDFVAIDNYMPLADWRDGQTHLDRLAGHGSTHDVNYLKGNIAGGEGYDWYYASDAHRDSQTRTPISDGTYGKPWVFRYKDLVNWWSNTHRNRPGGVQSTGVTAWVPQSKPIWLTEAGCPAVDKGANQPNVFFDAKSSESALPHSSGGQRDDLMQRSMVQAMQDYWGTSGAHNPVSSVYGAPMLRADRISWWCWDARPFPHFPARDDIWSDGSNYARGHWLNGRLAAVDLAELLAALAARYGIPNLDVSTVRGIVDGFVIDRPMSGRDALEALLETFALDIVESDTFLKVRPRAGSPVLSVQADGLVDQRQGAPLLDVTRQQETDLPRSLRLAYVDSSLDYRAAAVQQIQPETASGRDVVLQLPAAVSQSLAQQRVDVALAQRWGQRETAHFGLPPSMMAIEPGDVVALNGRFWRLGSITDGEARRCEALAHDDSLYDAPALVERLAKPALAAVFGPADVVMLDVALVRAEQPAAPWIAAQASPWPGQLNVLKQQGGSFVQNRLLLTRATMGTTLSALAAGMVGRVDFGQSLDVKLDHGALASLARAEVLAGGNALAVGTEASGFEILQFEQAELIAPDTYRLRGLLRAQAGSWPEMLPLRTSGQRVVLLNAAVVQATGTVDEASLASTWRIGPIQHDHGHSSYVTKTLPPWLKALRPLRPAQLRAWRDTAGLNIRWQRQTRSGGDSWELADVPLSEASEVYDLQVLDGSTLKRRWTVNMPSQVYSETQILADFGAWPAILMLRVAQVSAVVGSGPFIERIFNV